MIPEAHRKAALDAAYKIAWPNDDNSGPEIYDPQSLAKVVNAALDAAMLGYWHTEYGVTRGELDEATVAWCSSRKEADLAVANLNEGAGDGSWYVVERGYLAPARTPWQRAEDVAQ